MHVSQKQTWVEDSMKTSRGGTAAAATGPSAGTGELLRRRGLYLLRLLVDHGPGPAGSNNNTKQQPATALWSKYVACLETLEMEGEQHLVDQVWSTVAELFAQQQADTTNDDDGASTRLTAPPAMKWEWLSLLLARVLTADDAPMLRKLGLYRLFRGEAGILLTQPEIAGGDNNKPGNQKSKVAKLAAKPKGAPLSILSPEFLFDIVIPSYDSLFGSIGLTMHTTEENNQIVAESLTDLMIDFVDQYVRSVATIGDGSDKMTESFVRRLFQPDNVCKLRQKTTVLLFRCVARAVNDAADVCSIPVGEDLLIEIASSMQMMDSLGSVVRVHKESLLDDLATILTHSKAEKTPAPPAVLNVLSLYPLPERTLAAVSEQDP